MSSISNNNSAQPAFPMSNPTPQRPAMRRQDATKASNFKADIKIEGKGEEPLSKEDMVQLEKLIKAIYGEQGLPE